MRFIAAFLLVLPLVLASAVSPAVAGDRWLHVMVDEGGPDGEHVRLQLPLELIEAVLPHVETDVVHRGRVKLGAREFDAAWIRAALEAVRAAEDGEFVRVDGRDEEIQVFKRGAYLHVEVDALDRRGRAAERVRVKVPLSVVEALLTGDGDELDIIAAVRALDEHGAIDLASVEDGGTAVRVWVDGRSEEL